MSVATCLEMLKDEEEVFGTNTEIHNTFCCSCPALLIWSFKCSAPRFLSIWGANLTSVISQHIGLCVDIGGCSEMLPPQLWRPLCRCCSYPISLLGLYRLRASLHTCMKFKSIVVVASLGLLSYFIKEVIMVSAGLNYGRPTSLQSGFIIFITGFYYWFKTLICLFSAPRRHKSTHCVVTLL